MIKDKKNNKIATFVLVLMVISIFIFINFIFVNDFKITEKSINNINYSNIQQNVKFLPNTNEDILKKNGYMGSIERKNTDGSVCYKDLYTLGVENDNFSTKNLTFDILDYSNVEEEMISFANSTMDNKKLENFCQSIVFINYKNHNRGKIDLKVTKSYVDGSGDLAPYVNMWDIKTTMIISTYRVGLDVHYIENVAPIFLIGEDIINVSPVYTNAKNAAITINQNLSYNVEIQQGVEYDGRVANVQIGKNYNFEYGKSISYSFEEGSFSEMQESNLYWNIWGNKLDGVRFKSKPNSEYATIMNHEMVQRVAYHDNDNEPDDLSAFVGIAGIKIYGMGFAPDLSLGYDVDNNLKDDTSAFVIGLGWKADNSAHSYMADIISYNELSMSESHSNLPEDVWEHSYGYGY